MIDHATLLLCRCMLLYVMCGVVVVVGVFKFRILHVDYCMCVCQCMCMGCCVIHRCVYVIVCYCMVCVEGVTIIRYHMCWVCMLLYVM